MKKWYQTTPVIIFLILLCLPVGLYLMWNSNWHKNVKYAVTAIIAIIILCNTNKIANAVKEPVNTKNYKQLKKEEKQSEKVKKKEDTKQEEKRETKDKEFTLSAGNYTAGFDLPVGDYKLKWVSGVGTVMSSNKVGSGGINTAFMDNKEINNLKMSKYCLLNISNDLVVKVIYSKIEEDFKGKKKANTLELKPGKYTAGKDFEQGWYDIELIKGDGYIRTSNIEDGGLAENFGKGERKIDYFTNANLKKGTEIEVSEVTVKLISKIQK